LLSAKLIINVGGDAKEYVRIVGKGETYRRGSVSFSANSGKIEVVAKATDATALIASIGSALKQLKVVSLVKSTLKEKQKRTASK
jgi:tRNA threonylcarbamoyladenosine modification (KEOPS) complex  Pcc1 subunit